MKKRIAVIALATAALLATSVAATAKPAGNKLGGTLKVVNWEGYIENQWVKPFEKQTGCTVQQQKAGSSDEMYNLMKKNAGYDLVSASGDASNRLIASGLVQPIDPSKIPDWKQLTPQLVKGPNHYVDGKYYGLPWQWGPNVLMWNTAKYSGATNSWSALYDPKNKGKITIPNNPIQIADPALQFEGAEDPYSLDQATLDKVTAKLKEQKPLVGKYWVLATDFEDLFKSGDATMGAGWPLMTNDLKKAGMNVKEVIPKEGVTGWSDSWMISKQAKNPICAYKYMNYMTTPKVQAKVADVTGYSPANLKTCEVVGEQRCDDLHITDTKYYDSIKYWETPVSPTNYNQWTDAWAEVQG